MPSSIIGTSHTRQGDRDSSSRIPDKQKDTQVKEDDQDLMQVYLTIFVFRGQPDFHYNRHVLLYFTSSDDPNFCQTIHVQRYDEHGPWAVQRDYQERKWYMDALYLAHVSAGSVTARRGHESDDVVDLIASTPVEGKEESSDWNCQHFLLEGLQKLVDRGLKTNEWYRRVEDELLDALLDQATC